MNVCQIQPHQAENRLRRLVGEAPAAAAWLAAVVVTDWEALGTGQIQTFFAQHFKGHALADLVAALTVRGYHTRKSPPGTDGGVDILAG